MGHLPKEGHRDGRWWNQEANPGLPDPRDSVRRECIPEGRAAMPQRLELAPNPPRVGVPQVSNEEESPQGCARRWEQEGLQRTGPEPVKPPWRGGIAPPLSSSKVSFH